MMENGWLSGNRSISRYKFIWNLRLSSIITISSTQQLLESASKTSWILSRRGHQELLEEIYRNRLLRLILGADVRESIRFEVSSAISWQLSTHLRSNLISSKICFLEERGKMMRLNDPLNDEMRCKIWCKKNKSFPIKILWMTSED
jgi:hypothetical protein